MSAADRHNNLAPKLFKEMIRETDMRESETMVVLESVVFGVLKFYAEATGGDQRGRMGEMLTALHDAVVERFGP